MKHSHFESSVVHNITLSLTASKDKNQQQSIQLTSNFRLQEQLEERQAVEEKMETSGLSGLSKTVPAPQKQTTQTTREAEEAASSDEEEDDDEDGATTAPTEAVAAASVDLAVKALKTAKEHTISKRIQKKKKEKEIDVEEETEEERKFQEHLHRPGACFCDGGWKGHKRFAGMPGFQCEHQCSQGCILWG